MAAELYHPHISEGCIFERASQSEEVVSVWASRAGSKGRAQSQAADRLCHQPAVGPTTLGLTTPLRGSWGGTDELKDACPSTSALPSPSPCWPGFPLPRISGVNSYLVVFLPPIILQYRNRVFLSLTD